MHFTEHSTALSQLQQSVPSACSSFFHTLPLANFYLLIKSWSNLIKKHLSRINKTSSGGVPTQPDSTYLTLLLLSIYCWVSLLGCNFPESLFLQNLLLCLNNHLMKDYTNDNSSTAFTKTARNLINTDCCVRNILNCCAVHHAIF